MNLDQFAYSKFGNFVRGHKGYLDMKVKLRSAQIFKPYDEYVSVAIAIALAVTVIGLILGLLIGMFVFSRINIPHMVVYDPNIAKILQVFSPFKISFLIVIFGILFSLIIGGMVYTVVMSYPSLQASVRKVQIDTQLPFVVTYMYALSRGETNIVEIMRSVAELPNVYGETAIEFKKILRDIELLGTDFMTALQNLQKETPSPELSQFLGNMLTIIDNGGDVSDFLTVQIENYRTKTKSQHTVFLDMLAMIAESYVTGFVAGPLFMIIIAVTLGSMQSSMTMLLLVLTYAIIPLGSFGFIFIVDIMLPKDEQTIGDLNLRKVREFAGLRMAKIPVDERKLFEDYEKEKKWIHIKTILKNPTRALFDEPMLSLYITVPVALIVLAIPILSDSAPLFRGYIEASNYLTNYILLCIMIILLPYIIFFESRSRKILKIETAISHFLKHLSIINETGLPLSESLRIMLHTDIGPLRAHIEKMYTDMKWGSGVGEAFIRFANKIKVNMLSRTVALVTKASESSGNITDVLNIAATDSNISAQLKEEKRTNMFIYIIIIYTAFMVFLYVVYSLTTTFLPPMAKASQGGGATFIKNFDLEFYKVYFYHTGLVQGFFSGMMAGVLGEGNPRSGLKHSLVMMLIAFVVFKLLV